MVVVMFVCDGEVGLASPIFPFSLRGVLYVSFSLQISPLTG